MSGERKKISGVPANPWSSTLDRMEGAEPTQAGEDLPEEDEQREERTGVEQPGAAGYGADLAELGHDAAMAEPERPADTDVGVDPRTSEGEEFPEETPPPDADDEQD